MGAFKKITKFGLGGLIGSAVGVASGMLLAPESGAETQKKVRERIRQAKIAGVEAQAEKERQLISRFRLETNNREALTGAEAASKEKRDSLLREIDNPQLTE